jgi:hypothetical protein
MYNNNNNNKKKNVIKKIRISRYNLRILDVVDRASLFFCNPILFTLYTSTFNKLCKKRIQWHVGEFSLALLCN